MAPARTMPLRLLSLRTPAHRSRDISRAQVFAKPGQMSLPRASVRNQFTRNTFGGFVTVRPRRARLKYLPVVAAEPAWPWDRGVARRFLPTRRGGFRRQGGAENTPCCSSWIHIRAARGAFAAHRTSRLDGTPRDFPTGRSVAQLFRRRERRSDAFALSGESESTGAPANRGPRSRIVHPPTRVSVRSQRRVLVYRVR